MNDVQAILGFLTHRFAWVPPVMVVSRLVFKWFSGPLQAKLTAMMAAAATSPDAVEERDWESRLGARWYRVTAFGLDLVCSIKLPTLKDFLLAKGARGARTETTQ